MTVKVVNDAVDSYDPKEHILAILTGVFILVAGLSWNNVGRLLVEEYYPKNLVLASVIYAIILTVIVILILYGIVSWINSSPSSSQITIHDIDELDQVHLLDLDKKPRRKGSFISNDIGNSV